MGCIEKGITIVLTQRCNLKCNYCLRETSFKNTEDIGIVDLTKLLETIHKNGYSWVLTTGGEPFLHPNLFDYLTRLLQFGLKSVIETNGSFINIANLDKLASLGNQLSIQFLISLDHYLPEVHDSLRGPGAHQKAVDSIKIIKKKGFFVHVNRVITPITNLSNSNDLLNYLDFCESLKIDSVHLSKVIDIDNKLSKYILNKTQILKIRKIIESIKHKLLDYSDCESLWKYSTAIYCQKLKLGAVCITKNGISPCNFMPDIILERIENIDEYLSELRFMEFNSIRSNILNKSIEREFDCANCSTLCRQSLNNKIEIN